MKAYTYLDEFGSFSMEKPEKNSYLYFPLAGESGLKSSVTPQLGGDCKLDQNTFLLQPVSVEELHSLRSTRNFWCVCEGGQIWSATGNSTLQQALTDTPEEEDSVLEAGLMWHRMKRSSKKLPLSSAITSFVPCDERTFEVMQVKITNEGTEPLTMTPVSAVPMYCRSADNIRDHRHVTSLLHRTKVAEYGVQVTPTLTFDERGHKKNTKTYFTYGIDEKGRGPESCCPAVEDFIGEGGNFQRPYAIYDLRDGRETAVWKKSGAKLDGYETMGALRFSKITLNPGESAVYCIFLGITEARTAETTLQELMRDYHNAETVETALAKVKREWRRKVNVRYETGDPERDGYLYWVSFQPILRRMYGCSFLPYHDYGKGGRGWRDLWQDCLALLLMEPDKVREMLIANYGGVRADGSNATIIGDGLGEFLADRNHITRVWMDHGVWPFITTEFYIRQTGDLAILAQQAPYFKDAQIFRGEKKDKEWAQSQGTRQRYADPGEAGAEASGTVLEHLLLQNITSFYDVGAHNHIRLRGADWNDGFDMAAENGESVAFTAAYAYNMEHLADLLAEYAKQVSDTMRFHDEVCVLLEEHRERYDSITEKKRFLEEYYESCRHSLTGKKTEIPLKQVEELLRGMASWLKEHIRKTEWVNTGAGSFYNGYYDNHGRQLEGNFDGGVRMTLTGQVFNIMSGTATKEQISRIAESADQLLYREELGGYCLNSNFMELKDDMGRAFGFAYGHKENGAVFSHMAVMYANALYQQGFIKEGHKALEALYRQAMNFEKSRMYPGIPEYFSDRGRGMYPYLTGSASWLMLTMVTQVFGVRGDLGDLQLSPKLTREELDAGRETGIHLEFAGIPIHVRYHATEEKEIYTGVSSLVFDGETIHGDRILRDRLLTCDKKTTHEICAELI